MSEEMLYSEIWDEEPEEDDPFSARACYCYGYDVYADLLAGQVSFLDFVFLMCTGEPPTVAQAKLMNGLAVALANPGPREASVYAAMNAGVGGTTHAGSLIAALAVGAGNYGGGQELSGAVRIWQQCHQDMAAWVKILTNKNSDSRSGIWPTDVHPPGFNPHGSSCPTPVRQALSYLAEFSPGLCLPWLEIQREKLEKAASAPLAMTGVSAAAMIDLGLTVNHAEMLYLWLRLPGAAVHALEQEAIGMNNFPFYGDAIVLTDDPRHQG